jgi:hypothetical protein
MGTASGTRRCPTCSHHVLSPRHLCMSTLAPMSHTTVWRTLTRSGAQTSQDSRLRHTPPSLRLSLVSCMFTHFSMRTCARGLVHNMFSYMSYVHTTSRQPTVSAQGEISLAHRLRCVLVCSKLQHSVDTHTHTHTHTHVALKLNITVSWCYCFNAVFTRAHAEGVFRAHGCGRCPASHGCVGCLTACTSVSGSSTSPRQTQASTRAPQHTLHTVAHSPRAANAIVPASVSVCECVQVYASVCKCVGEKKKRDCVCVCGQRRAVQSAHLHCVGL